MAWAHVSSPFLAVQPQLATGFGEFLEEMKVMHQEAMDKQSPMESTMDCLLNKVGNMENSISQLADEIRTQNEHNRFMQQHFAHICNTDGNGLTQHPRLLPLPTGMQQEAGTVNHPRTSDMLQSMPTHATQQPMGSQQWFMMGRLYQGGIREERDKHRHAQDLIWMNQML